MPKNLEDVVASLDLLVTALKEGARAVSCPVLAIEIPGIAAADAFDANDCFGTIFQIRVPKQGVIQSATFWDMDDEGSQVDCHIFKHNIAQIASDAAWAPPDSDMLHFVTVLQFATFVDSGGVRTAELVNIGKGYTAPEGLFYIQAVTPSTPNIAAGNMPRVQLQILSGDPDFKE